MIKLIKTAALICSMVVLIACGGGGSGQSGSLEHNALPDRVVAFPLTN